MSSDLTWGVIGFLGLGGALIFAIKKMSEEEESPSIKAIDETIALVKAQKAARNPEQE